MCGDLEGGFRFGTIVQRRFCILPVCLLQLLTLLSPFTKTQLLSFCWLDTCVKCKVFYPTLGNWPVQLLIRTGLQQLDQWESTDRERVVGDVAVVPPFTLILICNSQRRGEPEQLRLTSSDSRQKHLLHCSPLVFPLCSPHVEKKSNFFFILFHGKELFWASTRVVLGLSLLLRSQVSLSSKSWGCQSCLPCRFYSKILEG